MKKIISSIMILCLSLAMLAGCGGSNKSYDVKSVVDKIQETAPVAMSGELDETLMADFIGVNMDNVEEFYGVYSMANVKSDAIIMVKAKSGKAEDVKADLEAFRAAKEESCAMYLQSEAEKAKYATLVTKGDYVILVIAGDSNEFADGNGAEVAKEIATAVDEATK